MHQHIRFVDEGQLLAAGLCQLEGVPNQAADPVCGVERHFSCYLLLRALTQGTAVTRIGAFGAFTYHHEVDLAGAAQRRHRPRVQPRGAQVNVVVKREP